MPANAPLPLLAAAMLTAAAATAQSGWPLPYNAYLADGHESAALPFGVPGFRTQILLEGSAVGPNGAVLLGLRFRADRNSAPLAATSVPNVTVQIGETTVASLGTTFAGNVTGPMQVVFQGTVALPAQVPGHAGPQDWDIVIPFAQSFVFTTQNGNLLLDIVANNPAGGFPTYWLDAVRPGGSATRYGEPGDNPSGDFLNLIAHTGNDIDPRRIAIGGPIDFSTTLMFTNPPGLLALGIQPTPGPIDLGFLGATNQFLHVDPLLFVPHAWTQTFIGFASTFTLALPNDPAWIDDVIYAQSALLDPTANPFGLVLSHAVEVRLGDPAQAWIGMQQLDADDPAAAMGTLLDFAFVGTAEYGAVPLLLEGVQF
ncbi:MAG: hypothetical protein KF830_12685 [Planctomycetes bacterium]|nr:hypothetical protein [Planctomycetota bacterium]